MRMWMVDPRILCKAHLLGEHVELHMLRGSLNKGKKVDGYLKNNCIELESIIQRHKELAEEIERRGYNHKSELNDVNLNTCTKEQLSVKINKRESLFELLHRCTECRENYFKLRGSTE